MFSIWRPLLTEILDPPVTPPVTLVGAVAVLLEPPFENLASRRTASVLTWSRMFVDIVG